jgi:hypothetical protein
LTEEPQKANISKRSKGFSSGVFLFSAKASKKATTTMQDLSEKKLQKSDLVEGNEEKGAGSGTAVESSSQSLAASRDEFFDASQYAFFGRGSSEDVELGGLDEDDGGEQLDDGDDAISNTGDREGSASLDTTPEWADDVSDLTSSFLKLNRISPRQEGQQNAVEEGRPLSTSREGMNVCSSY